MVGVESQQHRASGLDSLEALYSGLPGSAPNHPEKGVDCEGDAVMASARSQSDRARKAAGANQNQARKSGMYESHIVIILYLILFMVNIIKMVFHHSWCHFWPVKSCYCSSYLCSRLGKSEAY